ncbi:MAG: hypothetical protein JST76_03275 [Bacteroidetes bacterium]|nr:hypothetical protein [Bacteroidota bacterium]
MEITNHYNIALLDGDLLIIAPALPDSSYATLPVTPQSQPAVPATISGIAGRIHSREAEMPHLFTIWSD